MIGYKFVFYTGIDHGLALIKLKIPDDAVVVIPIESRTGFPINKLRCDKIKFIDVVRYYSFRTTYIDFCSLDDTFYRSDIILTPVINISLNGMFTSIYNSSFKYQLGEIYVSDICTDVSEECGKGLHFFKTIKDAMSWIQNEVSPWWLEKKWQMIERKMC